MVEFWEDWQLEILDEYLSGVSFFETQQELADYLNKELNAVKIKLSRRRQELNYNIRREIKKEEYILILSNRFTKSTEEISKLVNLPVNYILEELDELDCLECKEYLEDNFQNRELTNDECIVFRRLYLRGRSRIQMAHILNRSIKFIERMIENYEYIRDKEIQKGHTSAV